MQAAEITPGSDGMVPCAAAWRYFKRARYNASGSRTGHFVAAWGWWECTARFCSWWPRPL